MQTASDRALTSACNHGPKAACRRFVFVDPPSAFAFSRNHPFERVGDMAQVYFLIPGLIPGPAARGKIAPDAIARLKKNLGCLTDDPTLQSLGSPVFSKSVHLSWLWSVLTRRPLPFTGAPYAWAVQNGPMLSGDIWAIDLCSRTEGRLAHAALTHEQLEAACAALTPVLQRYGFVLQRWDPHLYLTRKQPLKAAAAPFEVPATQAGDTERWIEGEEKPLLLELIASCEEALASVDSSARTVWLSMGGGDFAYVYPPTKIRSVLTDNETVKGWALAAGILLQRIGPVTGAAAWPEDAPQGECIALIETLYEPWLRQDWAAWQAGIETVCERVETLSAAARRKGCDSALFVGTGEGFTVSCPKKLSKVTGLLARLAGGEINPETILYAENC